MLEESARGRRYAAIGLALAIGLFLGTLASAAFQYDFQQTLQWAPVKTLHGFFKTTATVRARKSEFKPNPQMQMQHDVPGATTLMSARPSSADVAKQRQLLQRLYEHHLGLPDAVLRRAVSHSGDSERLRHVLHKLIRGEPITVATVGGSVTAGVGAETQDLSYRERLFSWIRTTFPNDRHHFANGALAAAPSSYISQCIRDYAPLDSGIEDEVKGEDIGDETIGKDVITDLVFVEFTMNDGQKGCNITSDGRRQFELLLRKLLTYPKAPAVVMLHWWSPIDANYWSSPQDHLDVFAKFYGLTALSWRDAMHRLMSSNASGFRTEDLYFDKAHPNGHKGHRLFADIIIHFLRNEAAALILEGSGASLRASNSSSDVAPLQRPMLPGNYEGRTSCRRGKAFQAVVTSSQGWQWKNDGSKKRPKWGFVSWRPGNKLMLNVSTDTYRDKAKVVIAVGTLKSYQHMGQAQLTCTSGCECDAKLLEGHWKQKTSQTTWDYAAATQTQECEITITTLNSTSSGEHKVFVNSFLVTDVHAAATPWFSHVGELRDKAEREQQLKQLETPSPSLRLL